MPTTNVDWHTDVLGMPLAAPEGLKVAAGKAPNDGHAIGIGNAEAFVLPRNVARHAHATVNPRGQSALFH